MGLMESAIYQTESVIAHTLCMQRSLHHWTGRYLIPNVSEPADLAQKVFEAPFVLASHGTEEDPVLNYGNNTALQLWEMSWEDFTQTPSRFTAEPPNRDERARFLKAVKENGFIDNYSGIRISKTGRRFRITNAIVWNLLTEDGRACGQAAMFDRWEFV